MGRDIKTSALSTYGDLAMAIGVRFEKYLEITVRILFEAGSIAVDTVSYRVWMFEIRHSHSPFKLDLERYRRV